MFNKLQASLRNDSLLQCSIQRIQNDTQRDAPNNRSVKGLSPQNSIRSRASSCTYNPQVSLHKSPLLICMCVCTAGHSFFGVWVAYKLYLQIQYKKNHIDLNLDFFNYWKP